MTNSICPQCNSQLKCGVKTLMPNDVPQADSSKQLTEAQCWCMAMPKATDELKTLLADWPGKSTSKAENCLCQACLAKRYAAKINWLRENVSVEKMVELARPYRGKASFIEHLDFTKEAGYTVFSAWYHLKRGNCCGNGCKNCPF